jgi:PEGA domain
VNGPVQFAVEGDTVYLLGEDGSEHKTHMLKAILKSTPPPTLPPTTSAPAANIPAQTVKQPNLATVAFKSTPSGADITVDGNFVGSTPTSLHLAPGDHSILLQKTGFKDWSRTLTVSEGGNQTIDAALDQTH